MLPEIAPPNSNRIPDGTWPCYPDGNDWSYVDDLFTAVHKYNAANKATKTIADSTSQRIEI